MPPHVPEHIYFYPKEENLNENFPIRRREDINTFTRKLFTKVCCEFDLKQCAANTKNKEEYS